MNMGQDTIENTLGCFQSLGADDLAYINSKKTQVQYLKGETIFKQGAFAPHVLFVNDGIVKVYLQHTSHKQLNLCIAVKGDFMAYSSVFGDSVYLNSAVALVDSSICMIDKEALRDVLLRNPGFAMQITSRNHQHEKRYVDIITNLAYKQMRGKLASALLYLCDDKYLEINLFEHLNRQDVADFASITLESAIRFLKEFEKEGYIALDGKRIVILCRGELELISKNG